MIVYRRERVKRKKAAAKTEAIQTPTEVVDSEKQQPDLVELSKDLPPGWQVCFLLFSHCSLLPWCYCNFL